MPERHVAVQPIARLLGAVLGQEHRTQPMPGTHQTSEERGQQYNAALGCAHSLAGHCDDGLLGEEQRVGGSHGFVMRQHHLELTGACLRVQLEQAAEGILP